MDFKENLKVLKGDFSCSDLPGDGVSNVKYR